MTRRFPVTFKDSEIIEVYDIINFDDNQKKEVLRIASQYLKVQLQKDESKGVDLSYLTKTQKDRILTSKSRVVYGRNPDELRKEKSVVVTLHSQEQILERLGSDKLTTILAIIQKIIDADKVLKAQFKGYSSLSYTLAKDNDPEHYKLPISFKWVNRRLQILSVTVAYRGAPPSKMTAKIAHDDELVNRMSIYRKKLVERSRENEGHK